MSADGLRAAGIRVERHSPPRGVPPAAGPSGPSLRGEHRPSIRNWQIQAFAELSEAPKPEEGLITPRAWQHRSQLGQQPASGVEAVLGTGPRPRGPAQDQTTGCPGWCPSRPGWHEGVTGCDHVLAVQGVAGRRRPSV